MGVEDGESPRDGFAAIDGQESPESGLGPGDGAALPHGLQGPVEISVAAGYLQEIIARFRGHFDHHLPRCFLSVMSLDGKGSDGISRFDRTLVDNRTNLADTAQDPAGANLQHPAQNAVGSDPDASGGNVRVPGEGGGIAVDRQGARA